MELFPALVAMAAQQQPDVQRSGLTAWLLFVVLVQLAVPFIYYLKVIRGVVNTLMVAVLSFQKRGSNKSSGYG